MRNRSEGGDMREDVHPMEVLVRFAIGLLSISGSLPVALPPIVEADRLRRLRFCFA